MTDTGRPMMEVDLGSCRLIMTRSESAEWVYRSRSRIKQAGESLWVSINTQAG